MSNIPPLQHNRKRTQSIVAAETIAAQKQSGLYSKTSGSLLEAKDLTFFTPDGIPGSFYVYCEANIDSRTISKPSATSYNTNILSPVFSQPFQLETLSEFDNLRFTIWASYKNGAGYQKLPLLKTVIPKKLATATPTWHSLYPAGKDPNSDTLKGLEEIAYGSVRITLTHTPDEYLMVKVLSASDLALNTEEDSPSPSFAFALLSETSQQRVESLITTEQNKTSKPTAYAPLYLKLLDKQNSGLKLCCVAWDMDYKTDPKSAFLGMCEIPLQQILEIPQKFVTQSYRLFAPPSDALLETNYNGPPFHESFFNNISAFYASSPDLSSKGQILLSFQIQTFVCLEYASYTKLLDLLTQQDYFLLVLLYKQTHGPSLLPLLSDVLGMTDFREFLESLVLSANGQWEGPIEQAILSFMEQEGAEYLNSTMEGLLHNLVQAVKSVQFNGDVAKFVSQNVDFLTGLCVTLSDTLFASVDDIPSGFNKVLSVLKGTIKQKYGDRKANTVIGTVFFAKFLLKTVRDPASRNLRIGKLKKNETQILILISETLQRLAKLQEFKEISEPEMMPMNVFITSRLAQMENFLNTISKDVETPAMRNPNHIKVSSMVRYNSTKNTMRLAELSRELERGIARMMAAQTPPNILLFALQSTLLEMERDIKKTANKMTFKIAENDDEAVEIPGSVHISNYIEKYGIEKSKKDTWRARRFKIGLYFLALFFTISALVLFIIPRLRR